MQLSDLIRAPLYLCVCVFIQFCAILSHVYVHVSVTTIKLQNNSITWGSKLLFQKHAHLSPIYHFSPTSIGPTTTNLFLVSINLSFRKYHINESILSMILWRFFQSLCISNSLILLLSSVLWINVQRPQFNHSPVERHLGCLWFWAIMNKATIRCYKHTQTHFYRDLSIHFSGITIQECNHCDLR